MDGPMDVCSEIQNDFTDGMCSLLMQRDELRKRMKMKMAGKQT